MKIKFKMFAAVLLTAVIFTGINIKASEISDKFNELISGIGAANLSDREKSQSEWKSICLKSSNNSDKRNEAVKLMTEYLQKENVNGETAITFLSLLGLLGDSSTVPAIQKFLGNIEIKFVDETLAKEGRKLILDEAVRALARIPGKESAAALSSSNSIYARSGQIAHDKKRKWEISAETKMPMAIPYAAQKDVDEYISNFKSQNDIVKTQIIVNLGVRGDGKYLDLIKQSINSENNELRKAAIAAIVKLNSDNIIEPLIELLLSNDETSARAAINSLSTLSSKDVDAKLIKLAGTENDAKRLERISEILTNRKTAAFLPVIFERLKAGTVPNRKAFISNAAKIATAEKISDFIDLWLVISDRNEKIELEKIIAGFAKGDATAVLAKVSSDSKVNKYSLLGRIGDPKALPEFQKALKESSTEAFEGIREWPDATVANELLNIVKGKLGAYPQNDKVNALRSYIRVISLPQDKLKINATVEEQADMLISAFELATRDDERNLVIQRLGAVRHVKSLNFAVLQVGNDKLFQSAVKSILELSHHAALRRENPEIFKAALKLVLEKEKDKTLIDRANSYLRNF
ncbi:MAG: HEAT repeat domain-containing protein [Planctomycetaceae bacterium]|nr:HEAT repeat domain-containing protein [Planctomycetaceae bacterium]